MTNEKVLAALKRYMHVSEEGNAGNMSGKNEITIDCVETEQTKEDFKIIKRWLEGGNLMIDKTGISECNLDYKNCQNEPSNNQKLIKIAKKMLFKDVFASWRSKSNFEYDKEKDEGYNYCIWLKQIKRDCFNGEDRVNDIFEEMSLTDIKTFFEDDLYEKFSETFLKEHI